MNSGIYLIECNGVRYIGQAINLTIRINMHKNQLKNNAHVNQYMQRLWNKYSDYFSFKVIEYVDSKKQRNIREKYWIKKFDTFPSSKHGMNLTSGGDLCSMSEETKKKISIAQLGVKESEETKQKLSLMRQGENNSFYGKCHTEDIKNEMSEKRLGRKLKNGTSSEYHGVSITPYKTWKSSTTLNGVKIHIGTFKKEKDAALAYNDFVIKNKLPNPLNIIGE